MALVNQLRTWHRPLLVTTGLMVGALLVSAGGLLVDDRVVGGEPVWLKPFKFSLSIVVYGFTLAWLISLLQRGKRAAWWMGTISSAMLVVEMVAIVGQVVRGVPSHFSNASSFDLLVFRVMAVAIVTLWVSNLVVAVIVMRQRFVDAPTLWAIRFGLVLSLIGMAVAFMMTTPTADQMELLRNNVEPAMLGAHSVGVPDGGAGMPLTHWSTTGGDLRVPHFVGIHAMQVLPLFALLLGRRLRDLPELTRTRLVFVASFGYTGLLGLVTWQALRGQPLIYPDGLTLGVLGLLIAVTAIATTAVLRARPRVLV